MKISKIPKPFLIKSKLLIFSLIFLLYHSNSYSKDHTKDSEGLKEFQFVPLNKSTPLPYSSMQNIVVTNGKIVKVRGHGRGLLATGLKEGETTLILSHKKISLWVLDQRKIDSYNEIKKIIQDKMGLELQIQNNEIYLTGNLLRFSDWKEISNKLKNKKLFYKLKINTTDDIIKKIDQYTTNLISQSQLPLPSLSILPQAEAIISEVNKKHRERYLDLLEPLGFNVLVDKNAVSLEPIVDLKVQIVELKKNNFESFGISLPGSYKAQVILTNNFKVELSNIDIALNAMESSGQAKILATPHLSCRSGKEASFLAGGEFPIKIVNFHTNDIQWKKHGILLNFKPLADRSGKISLFLKTEISMLDKAQSVDGIPGILVNRVESHIDLFSNQTIGLSGLIKKQMGQSKQGLPVLQHLPVLGSLFSSEDYQEDRTDLVIFVTPKVLSERDLKNESTN